MYDSDSALLTQQYNCESLKVKCPAATARYKCACPILSLTTMSDNNHDQLEVGEEGELSEQEKQGVFQDLLSGSEYGLLSHFVALIFLSP